MFKTKQPDNQTTKSPNNYTMRKKLLLIAAMLASTAGLLAQSIEMLNNTTAELRLKDGGRVYVDFYGPHTFRIFEDPKGGVIRDPEAQPEAKILVDNPRRNPGRVRLEGNVVSTDEISVRMNLETAQCLLKVRRSGCDEESYLEHSRCSSLFCGFAVLGLVEG